MSASTGGSKSVDEEEDDVVQIAVERILNDIDDETTDVTTSSPRPLLLDSHSRPADPPYESALVQHPPNKNLVPSCRRCHACCDGTSSSGNNNTSDVKNNNNKKPHPKQLYFWHTHFTPKLLPSIDKILREEGPAGTVRILSCFGLVAQAVSLVLQRAAEVSMLVLSGLEGGDVQPTMKAFYRAVDGGRSDRMVENYNDDDGDDDDTVMGVPYPGPPCNHCSRYPSSSIRILRIAETTIGNGSVDANDEVSLSLFDFLGHPNCGIQQLDLSTCKLSPGAVRSLAGALAKNTTVNVLKLNQVQFMTSDVSRIEEHDGDLSHNSDHSRTGFDSSESEFASCPLATILKACICGESTKYPSPHQPRLSPLRELHLSQVVVSGGSDAMIALCQLLPSLQTLDLSWSEWRSARTSSSTTAMSTATPSSSAEPLTLLVDALTGNYKNDATYCLNHLVLSGIPLSEANMTQLCRALKHPVAGPLSRLECIELQNCQLTEASMLGMMESIPRWSTTLNRVDIARNFLRPAIVGGLLNAMERNHVLEDLGWPLLVHDKTHQSEHRLLEYLLDCNWAGRRVFRQCSSSNSSSNSSIGTNNNPHELAASMAGVKVKPGLWPYLLERINQKPIRRTKHHYSHDGPGRRESLLFAMLRGPALLEPREGQ